MSLYLDIMELKWILKDNYLKKLKDNKIKLLNFLKVIISIVFKKFNRIIGNKHTNAYRKCIILQSILNHNDFKLNFLK
jgi:hypothetical protein